MFLRSRGKSSQRFVSYLKPELSNSEFAKKIRKPEGFFRQTLAGVKHDLRQQKELPCDPELAKLLTESQRTMYQESILVSSASSASIIPYFHQANLGLPLIGNSVFAHTHAGLSQYVMDNHAIGTLRESLMLCTYYRTAISVEDLSVHFGYNIDEICPIIAKSFFGQYWANDDEIFNPMTRSYYPMNSHFTAGATDLGREVEFQAAKLYAYGCEGKKAPITIVNNGDTAVFTDGSMSMVQHMIEARERGYDFPLILQISSNNSAISQRVAASEDEAVARILARLHNIGITEGDVTDAADVVGGIKSMRSAVDKVRAGGGPRYVISKYPFRPLGHASDASPASDELILEQFDAFKHTLVGQLSMAGPIVGSKLADKIDDIEQKMDSATQHALSGVSVHRRPEIRELSAPGSTKLAQDAGRVIELPVTYVLSKGVKKFAGLGADIYGKVINATMDEMRAKKRIMRYVHQENHAINKSDTRGGVYGELGQLSEENLDENFVNFMPNEAQVAQVGSGLRATLPSDSVVICKGPHTLFNEHVKDFVKYAAYRKCDAGDTANTIYLMDGGSLAEVEKTRVGTIDRHMVLARVGEHHNTPLYSGYAFDPNIMLAVPMDVNFFAAMMPEMIKLYEQGRQILGFVPTNQFGALHPALEVVDAGETLGPNDVMRIDYKHSKSKGTVKPLNGHKLIIISWGPDSRWVCQYLTEMKIECTQFIVNYIHPPNALKNYLKTQVASRVPTEVVLVDPNPHAALLGPIMTSIRRELSYPDALHFSECTIEPSYVPWGNGESLLNVGDLEAALARRGIIHGRSTKAAPEPRIDVRTPAAKVEPVARAAEIADAVVFAPMDADAVQVRFSVQPGTKVATEDIIAEMESDKATIEIVAPHDGVLEEFFVPEATDLNVTQETKIARISVAAQPVVRQPDAKSSHTVCAPVDAETAIVTFRKSVGDTVEPDEVVAEVESDKATIEITAPCAGVMDKLVAKPNEEIRISEGDAIFSMVVTAAAAEAPSVFAPTTALSSISDPFEPGSIPLSKHQRQMVDNMSVRVGDTMTYSVCELMDFGALMATAKRKKVSPSTLLLKQMADAIVEVDLNKKLSPDQMEFTLPKTVDLGMAIEVEGQLRVANIRDVPNKSVGEIGEEIQSMVARGKYLSMKDQDLSTVCFTLSSLGKTATSMVLPTLIRGTTGILGVGRQNADGQAFMHLTCSHATLTGSEGATLLRKICELELE